ncbi:hypothetical protein [Halarchaeum nitratireducens]|nr:hypothetical protein [Halarchaeum nitratireducens]
MTVGSMGFSSVSASRDVSVSVADSEDAYIGVEACETPNNNSSGNGSIPAKVFVTNQYTDSVDVTVSGKSRIVAVGGQRHFNLKAQEGDTVTVHASGDGIDATIHATVGETNDCSHLGNG